MTRPSHPAITGIGQVVDDGQTVTVRGWHLGTCATWCRCHLHPLTGQLVLARDNGTGDLGLASFRTDGRRCGCCTPWTVEELAAILRDLADLATLPELAG